MDDKPRCTWPGTAANMVRYHDRVWGVPERDDRALFEKLVLDGFQAGLSWAVILNKVDGFRAAFDGFDPEIIARYDDAKCEALRQDARIVRNRSKIAATVGNARAYLDLQQEQPFSDFLWQFVGGEPVRNAWTDLSQLPAKTARSEAMSKALKQRGFKFCGPTITYAFMQAVGMVNDHLVHCFRYSELQGMA